MKQTNNHILTIVIFFTAIMSNKLCSMDNEKKLSLTTYDSFSSNTNKINKTFLKKHFKNYPYYGWTLKNYLWLSTKKVCHRSSCCQYNDDKQYSQAIKISINNATKRCNENEKIFIAQKQNKTVGFARANMPPQHSYSYCSEITYFICPYNKESFLPKIVQNIFKYHKNIHLIIINPFAINGLDKDAIEFNQFTKKNLGFFNGLFDYYQGIPYYHLWRSVHEFYNKRNRNRKNS